MPGPGIGIEWAPRRRDAWIHVLAHKHRFAWSPLRPRLPAELSLRSFSAAETDSLYFIPELGLLMMERPCKSKLARAWLHAQKPRAIFLRSRRLRSQRQRWQFENELPASVKWIWWSAPSTARPARGAPKPVRREKVWLRAEDWPRLYLPLIHTEIRALPNLAKRETP